MAYLLEAILQEHSQWPCPLSTREYFPPSEDVTVFSAAEAWIGEFRYDDESE